MENSKQKQDSRTSDRLTFDSDTHTYKYDDRVISNSVTGVINANFGMSPHYDDWYATRGTAIHQAIHLLVNDKLDWDTVDDRILPRVEAFVKFLNDHPFIDIVESELPLFSTRYQFAGTLDLILQNGNELILADIKSSLEPKVELQLGGYHLLWEENRKRKINKACAIELKASGDYNIKWYKDLKRARRVFLASLTLANWMKENDM